MTGKLSSALTMITGGAALAVNAAGDCLPIMLWLYAVTLVALIASTAQYVYASSERRPRSG